MGNGKYTAYHLFPGGDFPEAEKAGAYPYVSGAYQGEHGQRAFQGHYQDMAQKGHYAAPNTTCKDEQAGIYAVKEQFRGVKQAAECTDCEARVPAPGPNWPEATDLSQTWACASASGTVEMELTVRPANCEELTELAASGEYAGTHGTFFFVGWYSADEMLVKYQPFASTMTDHYNQGLGSTTYTETLCGSLDIEFSLHSGLDSPYGCYTDCCDDSGEFPGGAPLMILAASDLAATWDAAVNIGTVTADESCSTGSLIGTFTGNAGPAILVDWSTNAYQSNGITRLIEGMGTAGDADTPACCGGSVYYVGDDGCGGGDTETKTLTTIIAQGPDITPADTRLTTGQTYIVKGYDACTDSNLVNLTFTNVGNCVSNSFGSTVEDDTNHWLQKSTGSLALEAGHTCSGCCGGGKIQVDFNNGCNGTAQHNYYVYNTNSFDAAGGVGVCMKCVYTGGANFRVYTAPFDCEDGCGLWSQQATTKPSWELCLAEINATDATYVAAECAAEDCGYYVDNGLAEANFRSYAICAGDICCDWPLGGTLYKDNADCCPKQT